MLYHHEISSITDTGKQKKKGHVILGLRLLIDSTFEAEKGNALFWKFTLHIRYTDRPFIGFRQHGSLGCNKAAVCRAHERDLM